MKFMIREFQKSIRKALKITYLQRFLKMIVSKKATTTLGISSLSIAAILVTASLASIVGMMQTDAAAQKTVIRERLRGEFISAQALSTEGSITTQVFVTTFQTSSGPEICLFLTSIDQSTGTFLIDFVGCGPADELTVTRNIQSGTFSSTVTGFDFVSGEEMTLTVSGDLTATEKAQTFTGTQRFTTPSFHFLIQFNGRIAPASGSLTVTGDGFTFSTDDATGTISIERAGFLQVQER
jgi:hypothetical protein